MVNDIGAKIRFIRKLHGLSQEELGNIINYSRPAISNYEANTREVSIDDLQQLSDYFNISIMYFLDNEQSELEKLLLPYMEGSKSFNIKNLSPKKKTEVVKFLYSFEQKYIKTNNNPD